MTQKEFASLGGRARAEKLTPQRRSDIAKIAGQKAALLRKQACKQDKCHNGKPSENKVK